MRKKKSNPPVIRKGQKTPYVKTTDLQIEERVEFVARLLVKQFTKTEIHKKVCQKFKVCWRTCDRYLASAKIWLQKQAQMTSEEAKSTGINVLLGVFREGKPNERVSAERCWREIFGYSAPTKIVDTARPGEVVTITNPMPVQPQVHLFLPEGRRAMFVKPESTPPKKE